MRLDFNALMLIKPDINRMVDKGIAEAIKVERECRRSTTHFNLKGVDLDLVSSGLYPIKRRVMQQNNKSGLIGVHFHTDSKRWFSTFRKTKPIPFNNLFDAACKRKSPELTDGLI